MNLCGQEAHKERVMSPIHNQLRLQSLNSGDSRERSVPCWQSIRVNRGAEAAALRRYATRTTLTDCWYQGPSDAPTLESSSLNS